MGYWVVVSNISPGSGGFPVHSAGRDTFKHPEDPFFAMVVRYDWSTLETGQRVNLVVETVMMHCGEKHLFRIMGTTEIIVVNGFQHTESVAQIWTIIQGVVQSVSPRIINIDSGSRLVEHNPLMMEEFFHSVELCSGAGFMTTGAEAAGFIPWVGVEQNSRFGRLFHENHPGPATFLHGKIGDPEILKQALDLQCQGAAVFAGISCQPYSLAGDGLSEADPRSKSLPEALQFSWLIQAPAIVLECTPAAMHDKFVQDTIRVFASEAGFFVRQHVIHLDNCWGAKRDRWWAILTAAPIGPVDFGDLPIMPRYQTVKNIMPFIREFPHEQIDELSLSLYELGKFHGYSKGLPSLFLDSKRALPTALHAWGNQVYPCACGCRPGFSEARMQSRGLFAVLIPFGDVVQHLGIQYQKCRHMHPMEVALLCGARPNVDWGNECKLGLAAVGQMASPIQAAWVATHLRQAVDRFAHMPRSMEPHQVVQQWCENLINIRDSLWPSQVCAMGRDAHLAPKIVIQVQLPSATGGLEMQVNEGSTIGDLVKAETELQQAEVPLVALDKDGQNMLPSTPLTPGLCVVLVSSDHPSAQMNSTMAISSPSPALEIALARDLDLPMDLPPGLEAASQPIDKPDPRGFISDEAIIRERTHSFCVGTGVGVMGEAKSRTPAGLNFGHQEVLCKLQQTGLLSMLYPQVDTPETVQSLLQQTMDQTTRSQILDNQGMLWADDEIRFHLQQIVTRNQNDTPIEVVDPLLITSSLKHGGSEWLVSLGGDHTESRCIISAVCIHSHWVPILWRTENGQLYGFTFNASEAQVHLLDCLHRQLGSVLQCQDAGLVVRVCTLKHATGCGPIAIDFLHHLVFQSPLVCSEDRMYQLHSHLRSVFCDSLEVHTPRPWVWGQGQDVRQQLIAILRQHGVSSEEVDSRVDMLYTKVGKAEVNKAVSSAHPWKELKWAANQLTPPIQIIRPQELQSAIQQRSGQTVPVGKKRDKTKGKGKGKGSLEVKPIDPRGLRIEDGIFELDDGKQLQQAMVSDIGPFATGIILATHQECMPYLQGGKPISGSGLAVAIVDPPPDFSVALHHERLSFPVICAANSEPMILEAVVVQLGKQVVRKAVSTNLVELKSIATCVAKIAVFRDEWEGEWSVFVQHPMKCLIQALGVLSVCEDPKCSQACGRWHTDGSHELHDPILELWNRQWLTSTYSMIAPAEADLYSVTLRLPADLEDSLQNASGHQGIYVEPKGLDGRSVSPNHQVIWLPKVTASQARMYCQTVPGVLGLARLGNKYGLRCKHKDSPTVHAEVKPHTQFLPSGTKAIYLVGPVPWGTLKASLTSAFKEFGWECRPLNAIPAGKEVRGVMWKVQAVTPPPEKCVAPAWRRCRYNQVGSTTCSSSQLGKACHWFQSVEATCCTCQ